MGETMAVEAYGEAALRADAEACYELAVARAYLYTLFHKVLGGEPTTELLAAIGSEATAQAVGELAREDDTLASFAAFAGGVGDRAEDAAFVEEAQEEFARFFEGPAEPPAYPWEGPYLTRETMVFQPNTLAVRAAYADYGLQVRRLKHIPDDHVSIMAAFMADLSERAEAALRAGDFDQGHDLVAAMYRFSQEHMATWLPEYAAQSLHVTKAVLYPQVIHALRSLVQLDGVFLGETLAWLDEVGPRRLSEVTDDAVTVKAAALDDATAKLHGLRLRGLEDNELIASPR